MVAQTKRVATQEKAVVKLEPEPRLGEIRTGKQLAIYKPRSWHKYMYCQCPICRVKRWLMIHTGISPTRICHTCANKSPNKQKRKSQVPEETQVEIRRLYIEEKLASTDIAKRLNLRLSTVTHIVSKFGIARSLREAQLNSIASGKTNPIRERGNKNPSWKGGRHLEKGYMMLYAPEHPKANSKRLYIAEHILVWEQIHQRRLPPNWVVHHFNGIKTDNRPENLVAYPKKKHDQLIPEMSKRIRTVELENDLLKKALADQQALFIINEN